MMAASTACEDSPTGAAESEWLEYWLGGKSPGKQIQSIKEKEGLKNSWLALPKLNFNMPPGLNVLRALGFSWPVAAITFSSAACEWKRPTKTSAPTHYFCGKFASALISRICRMWRCACVEISSIHCQQSIGSC